MTEEKTAHQFVVYPTAKLYLTEDWYTLEQLEKLIKAFQQMNEANKLSLKEPAR